MNDFTQRMRQLTRTDWLEMGLVLLCITVFIAQGLTASGRKSASFDEQYHLSAGYSYLRTSDFRMATTHPPLIALLAGAGLLPMSDITLPLDDPSWAEGNRFRFSDVFIWERNEQSVQMIEHGRVPITVVLGALLILVTAVWARSLFGRSAMWMALALVTFEPNLVANSRIIATDFGVTVLLFVAMWSLWRWLQRPSMSRAIVFGLLAGMTMADKYSGVMVWPIALLILLFDTRTNVKSLRSIIRDGVIALVATMFTLWLVYRMQVGWVEVAGLRIPALAPFYWNNLLNTVGGLVVASGVELHYILGQVGQDGWWYYLPVAYLFKTPIALMLLTVLGFITVAVKRQWRATAVLWMPVAVFFALGVTGFVTLGYRHLLPMVPFTILLAANSVNLRVASVGPRRVYKIALAVLVLWVVIGSVRFYPNQESYFNELAGNWTRWSEILVDSNLDWGQDLPALGERMDELGIERINLAYFGNAVPEKYGIRYNPLKSYIRFIDGYELNAYNPITPEPGWYAISASTLRLGAQLPGTEDLYAFFREREPDARAGYSIYLYHVDYPAETEWTPTVVVDESVASYLESAAEEGGSDYIQARWLQNGDSEIVLAEDAGRVLDDDLQPVGASFEDVFALAAYDASTIDAYQPDETIELDLYWQRGNGLQPMPAPTRARSLSSFVQVVNNESGAVAAQYDGWDTAMRGLQAGDVVRQAVTLDLPSDLVPGAYTVIAGLYTPQTGRRLTVQDGDGVRDSVELLSFELQE